MKDLIFASFALVFLVLTAWSFTPGATNPTFYMPWYDDDEDQ